MVLIWHGYAPLFYVLELKNKAISFVLERIYKELLPRIEYIAAASDSVAKQLEKMYHVRSRLIYNGIELEMFRPCCDSRMTGPAFFNVTAYNNLKGKDMLIKYLHKVHNKAVSWLPLNSSRRLNQQN